MCGIFGSYNSNSQTFSKIKKPFESLIHSSHSRGKEASGVASLSNDHQIDIIKSDLDGKKLIKSQEYENYTNQLRNKQLLSIIGHSRLATHGSQLLHKNNQPVISASKSILGVHNGIITNSDDLWLKINSTGEIPSLDSQILIDYFEHLCEKNTITKAISLIFTEIEGSASIALVFPQSKALVLATNTGSLYYFREQESKTLFFASEKIFLEKISQNFKSVKSNTILHLKPMTGMIVLEEGEQVLTLNNNLNIAHKKDALQGSKIKLNINDHSIIEKKSLALKHYSTTNSLNSLKRHDFDYERIFAIKRCARCILPVTTPFISFDEQGICNYCHEHRSISIEGIDNLENILKKYRKGTGEPDCLAAFSGGRDSSYGLHFLKKELGMHPLAYTYDWGMVTDLARRNQARMLGKLGIEHILVSADITTKRKHIRENILAWMKKPHLGMVPLFMEGDKQCEFYADRIMKKYKLDLMFFFRGNELEKEEFKNGTCGVKDADPRGIIHDLAPAKKIKLLSFYAMQYFKNPAYFNSSFFDTGLAFFSTYIQKHNYVFLWHYLSWHEQTIIDTLIKQYNWETNSETSSTWRTDDGTSPFYNYIYYQIQGFTENDSFRARQVREGLLTRERALELAHQENKPRYEALQWYFDMVGLDGDEVLSAVDNMARLY